MPQVSVPAHGFRRVEPGTGVWNTPALRFGNATNPVRLWNTADAPPLYTASATLLAVSGLVRATHDVHVEVGFVELPKRESARAKRGE